MDLYLEYNMPNFIAAAGAVSAVGAAKRLEAQRFDTERRHQQDIMKKINAAHQQEKQAASVIDSIHTWCDTHKEILFLDNEIRVAEAELEMYQLAVWAASHPRCCLYAEAAIQRRIQGMKKRINDLKAVREFGNGALLLKEIKEDMVDWHSKRIDARMKRYEMMQQSAKQSPRSWPIAPFPGRKP